MLIDLTGSQNNGSLEFTPFWWKILRKDLNFLCNRKSQDRNFFTVAKGS